MPFPLWPVLPSLCGPGPETWAHLAILCQPADLPLPQWKLSFDSGAPGPHCAPTASHLLSCLPSYTRLNLNVTTGKPPGNLSQLSTFGRRTGLGVRRWSPGYCSSLCRTLAIFFSMHQRVASCLSLSCPPELPGRRLPIPPTAFSAQKTVDSGIWSPRTWTFIS